MHVPEEESFLRNLVFRLVRKHMAGPTIATALNKAKQINEGNMNATMTFLNDHVDNQAKAKYNANAYMQLIRQISRLSISADVSVRMSQLGYNVDKALSDSLFSTLLDNAEKNDILIWSEYEPEMSASDVSHICKSNSSDLLGVEVPDSFLDPNKKRALGMKSIKHVKVLASHDVFFFHDKKGPKHNGVVEAYMGKIRDATNSNAGITISSQDERLLLKAVSKKAYRKDLILEVPFGYSKRKLKALSKDGQNLNVYTPYGKDWIPYAVHRLTTGKTHRIATRLLDGGAS